MAVRDTLIPVMAAFIGIDVAVVLARVGVRIKLTTLGYDDYVIVVALIGFILMCSFCYVSLAYGFGTTDPAVIATLANYNVMEASRYFTIAQVTYVAGFPIVRISVALVLHRIVQGWPRTQKLLVASMVFVGVYALGCLLVDCCSLGFAVSALDIASALFYAVLPVFLLKGLQMGTRTKVAIIVLLGLGAGTVIVSIVRLKSLIQIVNSTDIAAALDLQLESFVYSVLEFGISTLTASLVAFRPLIKYIPFGSHGRSSGYPAASRGHNIDGGTNGTNNFEMGRRNYINVPDPARIDSDDGDSQRNILREAYSTRDWKHSEATIKSKDK